MTFIGKQTVQYVLFANRTCLYLHWCPDLRMILGIGCLSASYQVWVCTVVSKEEIYISCQHSRGITLNQDILPETRSQLGIPKKVLCSGRSQQVVEVMIFPSCPWHTWWFDPCRYDIFRHYTHPKLFGQVCHVTSFVCMDARRITVSV